MTISILEKLRRACIGALAASLAIATAWVVPAYATIDNNATASGTFNLAPVTSNTDSNAVPVAPAGPALTASKTFVSFDPAVTGDPVDLGAGDTITYTIQVNNTGNVTLTNVIPVEDSITFGGQVGGGAFSYAPASVASLVPGANTTFTATYTLTALDIYNGAAAGTDGVENVAHGQGTFNAVDYSSPTSTENSTVAPDPELLIAKSFVLTKGGANVDPDAEIGDTITYTYTITNTGNVAIDNVTVSDTHEPGEGHEIIVASTLDMQNEALDGGSPDPLGVTADAVLDGSWDLLGPESIITFIYVHTVLQPEFESQ